MPISQARRTLSIETQLGRDEFLLVHMTGRESLGQSFHYELKLLSERRDISPAEILGTEASISLLLPDGRRRWFHGHLTQFHREGKVSDRLRAYRATLRPRLWFLTQTTDCRIFQDVTVEDILGVICEEGGIDFQTKLQRTYPRLETVIQYRETDFAFLSRLAEDAGIYYYFEHQRNNHKLVFCDMPAAHRPFPGYEELPYAPESSDDREVVREWEVRQSFLPGTFTLDDYNFAAPTTDLEASSASSIPVPGIGQYEIYDYPGGYQESGDGNQVVKTRRGEVEAQFEVAQGLSNARGLAAGFLFTLSEHEYRNEAGVEYLLTAISLDINEAYKPRSASKPNISCALVAIPAARTYRPMRVTPRAVIQGMQTATVIADRGEEIKTDVFGRVQVQFHWDREGSASGWIRVAQMWSGVDRGSMAFPRAGDEVVLAFLEGNPDRPIIIGSLYNGARMPPYALPDNKTVTTFRTHSSPGGAIGQGNEIYFDDEVGKEQLKIKAERDQSLIVGNDRTLFVGHDETIDVQNDRRLQVSHDETFQVENNRTISIGGNESQSVGEEHSKHIGGNSQLTVGQQLNIQAGGDIILSAGQASLILGQNGDIQLVGRNISVTGSENMSLNSANDLEIKSPITITIESGNVLTLKGGLITLN